jgi:hypothetical protein
MSPKWRLLSGVISTSQYFTFAVIFMVVLIRTYFVVGSEKLTFITGLSDKSVFVSE